jgi:tetratricopeptide (TPR) repeat protein
MTSSSAPTSQTPAGEQQGPGGQLHGSASDHGRVYQAGRDQSIVQQQTVLPPGGLRPIGEVVVPLGFVGLPGRPELFVGREAALTQLKAALAIPASADSADPASTGGAMPAGVVVQAVHGLGGIGKSTLAAHYAATCATDHSLVWWITADSADAVASGLAALAVALEPELTGALPLEGLAQRAVQWLAAHDSWLLILDNVTGPPDVAPLLARVRTGRFLITSRLATGWHQITSRIIRLDVLDEDEAIDLLTRIAAPDHPNADLDGSSELCAELGFLPLAIEQAAAYLRQAGLGPRGYLQLLASYPSVVYDQSAEGGDSGRTVARIWRITLDRLAGTPLAGDLLRILAWYAPDGIPRTLLASLADPPEVAHSIGRLAAYNLVTTDDDDTLAIHRLVQAVARTSDGTDPHRQDAAITAARDQAARQLNDALPENLREPTGWPLWRVLIPHITALMDHTRPDADTLVTARLVNQTGLFLNDQGALARAILCHQRSLSTYLRVLGGDHPSTLTSRNNLAYAYQAAGDLGQAIPLYEQTLTNRQRVLGGDHPDTLTSRNNLAYAYRAAGDLELAIALYEQTLTNRQRVLGGDHPSTLTSRNNLAYAYRAAGDLELAIALYEQTLTNRQRVLGGDHPSTLTSRNNLAYAYRAAGDLERAIPLHQQTLADRQRVLGGDHPSTLISHNNLAGAYRAAGDLERAIPLYEQTLADCERVLSDRHPLTGTVRANLAALR